MCAMRSSSLAIDRRRSSLLVGRGVSTLTALDVPALARLSAASFPLIPMYPLIQHRRTVLKLTVTESMEARVLETRALLDDLLLTARMADLASEKMEMVPGVSARNW